MTADQRLADLAELLSRQTAELLLALQREQELGRFVAALPDQTEGKRIDTVIREATWVRMSTLGGVHWMKSSSTLCHRRRGRG